MTQQQVDEKALTDAIASRTLSWLTGSSSNNDYISVGRLANYFGFVGLRVASGHSLSRSQVAKQTLAVLDKKQTEILLELVEDQKAPFKQVIESRYEINRALEGLLVGESLSRTDFLLLGQDYGQSEAELGRVIAQSFGQLIPTLTNEQREQLQTIREAHLAGRGHELSFDGPKLKMSKADKKELTNLAARLLSWSTGSAEFNDFEVVGKPSQHFGFVSLRIESNHGVKRGKVSKEVMSLLTDKQGKQLQQTAKINNSQFQEFMQARGKLLRTLEVALEGEVIDKTKVIEYGKQTGILEASMTWEQAQVMLEIRQSLTQEQASTLLDMRRRYTAQVDLKETMSSLDRGRQLYAQCSLCHSNTFSSTVAPNIDNVVGKRIASDQDFRRYSDGMQDFAKENKIWTEPLLQRFLASPKTLIPGTYMSYRGLDNRQDRDALLKYMSQSRN
ncbi:hypothetical protein [Vibrio superstes]|uniref:hypothetical protein n=1 Tax=Vibrio superstes TaxID=198815 RepID=UPI0011BE1CE8|nr:hypothetical protein [Vibrio superstes]